MYRKEKEGLKCTYMGVEGARSKWKAKKDLVGSD